MAKLIRVIPCLNVLIDKETNAATYFMVVEQVGMPADLPVFPPIVVGMLWRRTRAKEKLEIRVRIEPPVGESPKTRSRTIDFEDYERFRLNLRLPAFNIEEDGICTFYVEHLGRNDKWVQDGKFEIPVVTNKEDE